MSFMSIYAVLAVPLKADKRKVGLVVLQAQDFANFASIEIELNAPFVEVQRDSNPIFNNPANSMNRLQISKASPLAAAIKTSIPNRVRCQVRSIDPASTQFARPSHSVLTNLNVLDLSRIARDNTNLLDLDIGRQDVEFPHMLAIIQPLGGHDQNPSCFIHLRSVEMNRVIQRALAPQISVNQILRLLSG